MAYGCEQQKLAVDSGVWPLYRFDPRRVAQGQPPLLLDSGEPKIPARQYMRNETRFRMVEKLDPERFKRLLAMADKQARQQVAVYKQLAGLMIPQIPDAEPQPKAQGEPQPAPEPATTKH
jgi:pyruvate-ferredoxin/flavodoxin oxidoreductase